MQLGSRFKEALSAAPRRRNAAMLAALLAMPLSALAVDLQVVDLSDTGYDPVAVGTVVNYKVSVVNGASTAASDTVTLFDLPAGTALAAGHPAFCSAVAGAGGTTRVTCVNPGSMSALDPAHSFTLPVTTLQRPVGEMTVLAAIGFASAAPAADTPLSSLAAGDAFFGAGANLDTNQGNNKKDQVTTLTEATDLVLAKTATPDPVIGGGEITYTLTVTNKGPSIASGFVVTDSLDANTSLVAGSASGAGWTFNGAHGTYTGSLAVGASASYRFKAKANIGSGTVTNGASVATGPGQYPDKNPDNNNAQVRTNVTAGADLTLTKTAAPVPATAGETITFTLTARNLGPSAASNVRVTDPLPSGFVFVSATPSKGSCVGGSTVNCSLGNMANGEQQTITIVATVPLDAAPRVTNTASITSDTPDPFDQGTDNQGRASFDVLADGADLSISKSKTKARVPVWKPGQPLADSVWTSIIMVRNGGPRAVTGDLQVVETLAVGEKWVDAAGNDLLPGTPVTQGNWLCSVNAPYQPGTQQVVTCDMLSGYPVAHQANVPLQLHTLPLVAGDRYNHVCTGGGGSSIAPLTQGGVNRDPNLDNNCTGASATATDGYVDLKISKRTNAAGDADNTVSITDTHVDFTISVHSSDNSVATGGVVINDTLPGHAGGALSIVSQSHPAWSCTTNGGSFSCRSGNTLLLPGLANAFTVTVRAPRPLADSLAQAASACTGNVAGRFCNTAGVGIDLSNPNAVGVTNAGDDSASDWFAVHPVANVSTTAKRITSGSPGRAGVNTTYVIDYLNQGPSAVAAVVMRDVFTLPANDAGFVLLNAASSKPGSTCGVLQPLSPGIVATPASGGTSYANTGSSPATLTISCSPIGLANSEGRNLEVTIRPNVDAGNTSRTFSNVADFFLDRNNDGLPDPVTGVDANGIPFNHNSDTSAGDDSKSALLPFEIGEVDLLTNKEDTGFSGGVDPLGFDSRPGQSANNMLMYRISVLNRGPSLATGSSIQDTITAPAGASIRMLGSRRGNLAGPMGPLELIGAGALCRLVSGSNPTALGGPMTVDCDLPSAGTGMLGNGQIAADQTSYLYLVYEYLTAPPASGATILNEAIARSNERDTSPGNNTATESTAIRTRSDLEVVKLMTTNIPDADPSVAITANTEAFLFQPLWYVLDITNLGPGHSRSVDRSGNSPLNGTGTVVTDVLADGLELIEGAQVTWRKKDAAIPSGESDLVAAGTGTCSQAGRTLTCALGDLALDGKARVLIPARWVTLPANGKGSNSVTLKTEQVDPTPGNDGSTVTNDIKVSSLAGRVFEDSDRSAGNGGIYQATERALPSVTLVLSGNDFWGNPVSQTTTTGNDGRYKFDNLPPSGVAGYTITQTQPSAYNNGPLNPPLSGADAPSVGGVYERGDSRGDSNYSGIVLAGDTHGVRYDFPEVRRPGLSGVVYVDVDFSDAYGSGTDTPIAGATVELLNAADGSVIATGITDATGNYRFNDLDPEITYTLREVLPTGGYRNRPSAVNPGTINGQPCAAGSCIAGSGLGSDAVSTDRISNIDLSAGFDGINFNFGEDAVTSISGTVYLDRNDNGSLDGGAGDAGIAGVTINLEDGNGTVIATTTTANDGSYSFAELVVGKNYIVVEVQPSGYANGRENPGNRITINNLPLAGSSGNNFGERLGSLTGFVFEDFSATAANNNNGRFESSEQPIPGVVLTLTGTDINGLPVNKTTTTEADGSYRFDDLMPADAQGYVLTETQPGAYLDGKHTAGNGVVTGSNAVANVISGINLSAGQQATGYLFGELANAVISGTVYLDRNDDGDQQPVTEPGIGGVTITITGAGPDGVFGTADDTTATVTTEANGNYSYGSAVAGQDYRVSETQPNGLANGQENSGNLINITNLPKTGSTDNNFGELAASLAGMVYLDSNNNGVRDAGEPALPGVEVSLPASVSNALGVANLTVTTDADGNYVFQDLLAGTYVVTQQLAQPLYGGATTSNGKTTAGSIDGSSVGTATPVSTVPSAISGIVLPAGKASVSNNFGEVLVAAISGTVYVDRNDNGGFDAADAGTANSAPNGGIAGVEVVLYEADGVTELAHTTTDAQGNYVFANLPTGVDYVVKESQPAGYAQGQENGNDTITITNLPLAGSNGNNFGELLGSLGGFVYEDFSATGTTNNNGSKDAGENPIPNVTLTLTDKSGLVIATVTTDSTGAYRFGDLLAGDYTITQTQPAGYEDGKHTAGNANVAGNTAVSNVISGIGLSAGQQAEGYLFGELKKVPISGTVYIDRDDNGSRDPADPGIPGVEIEITSNGPDGVPGGGDDVKVTVTTDQNGKYTWPDALPGVEYTITEKQPVGLADGKETPTNVITIPSLPSSGSDGNNFGEKAAVLSGVVYLDSNNNGIQDAGEPGLSGVQVSLPAGVKNALGQTGLTATTDADGNYVFQDLLAGTYTVTQQAAQPAYNGTTTTNGKTTAGTTGGAATPVATTPSAISGISLVAGGLSTQNNFGEVLPVSIAGAVFLDINNDGAMVGANETGLEGIVIELTGVDDTGAAVSLDTTTDKDGKFSFDGLRPGKYTLTEPTQPTGTANGITTAGNVAGTATGVATPVTTVPSVIAEIDLSTPGSASVDNLFGEIPRSSGISGKVWEDTNNDGVIDPSEKGIGGVTVELEGTAIDGTPIKVTVTTDPDGNYSFTDLPPGTYTVTEPTQPPGTLDGKTVPGTTGGTPTAPGTSPSKISTITVGVNETSSDNNFGEIPVGSISGFVYNDSNDDGIKQADEGGYASITVVLTGTDDLGNPVSMSVTTAADGSYTFKDLRPGTYVVTEPDQPAETLNGLTTAGTIDGASNNATVTDKATAPSAISGIVLQPGDNSVDNNFGEIGDSPDMLVSKSSNTVKFTVNNVATYTIRVRNGGQKPSFGEYLVKDRLPVGLTLAEVPAGNGWTCSGAVGDARFECRSSEVVNAGATSLSEITVKADVSAEAAKAGTVNNAVLIEGGGENEFRTPTTTERSTFEGDVTGLPVCDATITRNACRVPNEVQLASSVGGTVWFDIGNDDALLDGGDDRLHSWIVELVDPATGAVTRTTTTATDGSYHFGDVVPGVTWHIQFRDPTSGVIWAWPVSQENTAGHGVSCDVDSALANGHASTCRTSDNGSSQLQVVLKPGEHLPQQSLPVDPSGVVYDATTRDPVPGSIVTLTPVGVCNGYDPLTAVLNAAAGGYTVEGNAISMTVGSNGYYQFVFGPAAPARCEFRLTVTPPGGYQFVSSMIPPQDGSLSPPGAQGSNHLVQPQATAPTGAVGTATQYWLTLFSGSATAGIIHNHIPLDTAEATGLVITKTGDRQTAEIGDTVQYTITVRQTAGSALQTVNIVDTLPRGFTYIDGTGRVGGRAVADPLGRPGPRLGFDLGGIDVGGQLVLTYRVRVGVGAQQGDGVNRAQAHGCSIAGGCIDPVGLTPVPGSIPSNRAEYRVRVTGGVFTEEACVLGKVFVDCNNNHVQDSEELGIPGVRLYFSNGTWMISDSEGKYSYCGLPPQSHTLKVDPSTLPVGSRLTTSSNRNLGDADSLFLDLKNGELHRADFVEGSCSNPLLEQVKARRTQGEVRAPETEAGQSPLRFDSKPVRAPQQATDSANQRPIVQPRPNPPPAAAAQEVQP